MQREFKGIDYINDEKLVTENPKWPINPQYLITFDKNTDLNNYYDYSFFFEDQKYSKSPN